MTKKKSDDKQDNQDQRSAEQMMRDLERLLNSQDFESVEDLNQFLQQMLESGQPIPAASPASDLDRAQDLIYQAHEMESVTQAIKLARKALKISPDCADAYVMLAEYDARTIKKALELYEKGVKAGERALGAEFDELKGHFWGVIETRPYMRARLGLANTLWELGRLEEAAQHMDAMLELNPNDNQGVRQLYITLLMELNDTTRIEKLFKQYPDDWSAAWKYNRALYEFRKKGPSRKADRLLKVAIVYNPHVPLFLLGKKKMPGQIEVSYYSPGDEIEAADYLLDAARIWKQTEGALGWLQTIFSETTPDDKA